MAKAMKEHKVLYLLMVPGLLYFVLFRYLPMFGLVIAFKDYNIFKGIWASDWVGLANFEALVHSSDFWNVMKNTLVISLTKILIGFPIPILLAILLNDIKSMRFKRVTQTFFIPPSLPVMGRDRRYHAEPFLTSLRTGGRGVPHTGNRAGQYYG